MYKKILCLSLVLLMVFSCFAASVSAYEPSLESLFKDPFIKYVQQDGSTVDEEFLYINYIGSAGKCSVYRAYYGEVCDLETSQIIGDYKFTYGALVGDEETNPTGLYAWDEFGFGILTLKEAYDKGYADLDALYQSESYDRGIYPLTEGEKEALLKEKCKEAYTKEFDVPDSFEFPVSVHFVAEFENYTVFRASHLAPPQMHAFQYIDGYWLFAPCIWGNDDNNPTGLYTLDNYGNVESLKETAGKGFIDMDEIYTELSEVAPMYLRGDIDNDKKLTVKDATVIQKYLAKIPEGLEIVNNHDMGYCVMEADEPWGAGMFNSTSEVSIKDATYIQKKVANIIKDSDDRQPFEYNEILISFYHADVPEYTLEDFPEYEFESIERWGSKYLDLTILTLHLKNSGKDNVINAVNSLKHREGTEFDSVHPNWLAYSDVYFCE